MRDLSQLELLTNASAVIQDIETVQDRPDMVTGRNALTTALNAGQLNAPVFLSRDLARYALLAYQFEQITHDQMVSTLLHWGAIKDYNLNYFNIKLKHLTQYTLDKNDTHSREIFEQFTTIESIEYQENSEVLLAPSKEKKDTIFKALLQENIPVSERSFLTFETNQNELPELIKVFKEKHFKFFQPKQLSDKKTYLVMIPSISMIQTTLNHMGPSQRTLVPRIGDDTFEDVFRMHCEDKHPIGISYPLPGFERLEADTYSSGRFGFALHDLYHITILVFTPFTSLLKTLVNTGKEIIANTESQALKNAETNVSELMMDNEFREYTQMDFLTKYSSSGHSERLKNPEMAFINIIHAILIRREEFKKAINAYHKMAHFLTEKQQKKLALFCKWSDDGGALQQFVGALIQNIVNDADKCKQAGISLSRLLDLLHPLNPKLLTDYKPPNTYGGSTLRMDTFLECIQLFRTHLFNKKPIESSFLSHYFLFSEQLSNAVLANDVALCKQLLSCDDYKCYITQIDHVGNNQQPLVAQAIAHGYVDIVQLLGLAGANVSSGAALITAAKNKNSAMLACLLKMGASPYENDEHSLGAIDYCLQNGDSEGLRVLLQKVSLSDQELEVYTKAEGGRYIHQNCQTIIEKYKRFKRNLYSYVLYNNNKAENLRLIIEENTEGFAYTTLIDRGSFSFPFITAIKSADELTRLNEHVPIDFHFKDKMHNNLLHFVFQHNFEEEKNNLIQEMLNHGVNPMQLNAVKSSPLHLALVSQNMSLLKQFLLCKGCSFSQKDIYSIVSILEMAGWNNKIKEIIKLAIHHGLDLSKQFLTTDVDLHNRKRYTKLLSFWTILRNTPIDSSNKALNSALELRKMCIENGADPDELDFNGELELTYAITNDLEEYVLYLLDHGANINKVNANGDSALHWAVKQGKVNFVKLFLANNAHRFTNQDNQTPLEIATLHGEMEIQKLLKDTVYQTPTSSALGLFANKIMDIPKVEDTVNNNSTPSMLGLFANKITDIPKIEDSVTQVQSIREAA